MHGFRFLPDIDGPVVSAAQKPLESLAAAASPQLLRHIRQPAVIAVVHEAQRELIYASLSVKQIAAELGFDDEAHSGRFFKKHTGRRPTEFREMARRRLAGGKGRNGRTGQVGGSALRLTGVGCADWAKSLRDQRIARYFALSPNAVV